MAETLLRVIKLGGSLLDWPELPHVLGRWLSAQPAADNLLIAGGGDFAEAIRKADRVHQLGEEASHWLCIRAMGLTARLVAALLPAARLVDWLEAEEPRQPGRLRIVDPSKLLMAADGQADMRPLPHRWDVTSDSIAAWLAWRYDAAELVLLKSTLMPAAADRATAANVGLVDVYFAEAAAGIPRIRCVNLRGGEFEEASL